MMVAVAGAQHNINCTELGKQGTVIGNRHTRFPSFMLLWPLSGSAYEFLPACLNQFISSR
jgi:hypothetical protein